MQKTTWGGLGAWMLALAVGLISSGWPELIRPHPYWVIALAILGALMLAYPGMKWVYMTQKGLHPRTDPWEHLLTNASGNKWEVSPKINSGNFVGGDNSGPQVNTGGGAIFGDSALKEIMRSAPVQPEEPPKPPNPIPSPKMPVLLKTHRMSLSIKYDEVPGQWTKATSGDIGTQTALLLFVENPLPDKGACGVDATGLVAHLKFHHMLGTTAVMRAYWLHELSNQVDLPGGLEKAVVIGHLEGKTFISYENLWSTDTVSTFDVPFRAKGRRIEIPAAETFKVDVSIVEVRSNQVIEKKRLTMLMPYAIVDMD